MIRFILIWLFEWVWCLSNLVINPRKLSYKHGFKREVRCKSFDHKTYETWRRKSFALKSQYGYSLSCELLEENVPQEEGKDKKIAILCHGLGCAKYQSIKYAQLFIKLGYTVLIYDHRNHGLSGKASTSMGYFEKFDLKHIVTWCKTKYGRECKIITHGESMGAATVLLHMEIDDLVDCVIADCSYSDFRTLLRHQLKQFYHLPPVIIPIENIIIYFRAGFWLKEVSPIQGIKYNETPVLLIHGKRDNFVPSCMSKELYHEKKKNKALYLVAKAKHAESYCTNKMGYEKRVTEFLEKYMK